MLAGSSSAVARLGGSDTDPAGRRGGVPAMILVSEGVLAAWLAELVAALFAAAVALSFRRQFPRGDLRWWGWAWCAAAVWAGAGVIAFSATWSPGQFTALRALARSAAFLQAVGFLAAAHKLTRAGDAPAWLRYAALGSPALGVGSALVSGLALPTAIDLLLRALASVTVGVASLTAAVRVWRRPIAPPVSGVRLMAVALAFYGVLKLFSPTTLSWLGLLEGDLTAPALYIGFALAPAAFALGGAMSLLEDRQRELAVERDRLRVSEEKFATLFRSSPDAVLLTRPLSGDVIVAANRGFERLFGRPAADAVGKTAVEVGLGDLPPDRAPGKPDGRQARPLRDREVAVVDGGGRPLILSVSAENIEIDGEPHQIIVARDVTARRDAERRLRESEEALSRSKRMAAIGALVAGVAHEVRTPLFGISASLDAYQAQPGRPGEPRELIEMLRAQVNRLSALMRDLLDYGRPPALHLSRGGVEGAIRKALRACASIAEQAGVTLTADLRAAPFELERDPDRLEQVFHNLLSNAVHHSPRGAVVRVRAGAREAPVPGVLCTVEDEGPGIRDEDLTKLFEPFFSRRRGGTGLGLAVVQQIVEEHGGTIEAANRPSGGAVFTVFLPAQRARAA